MSRNKKRKSHHSHSKKYLMAEKNKASKNQNDKYESYNQYSQENEDEMLRKHKSKKSKHSDLNIVETIILLLILKEKGILDDLLEMDDFKDLNMNSKFDNKIEEEPDIGE